MNMLYECWAYVKGKPDKMVKVSAKNSEEATVLAMQKFESIGVKFDYVKCK